VFSQGEVLPGPGGGTAPPTRAGSGKGLYKKDMLIIIKMIKYFITDDPAAW
jgi:hypothetical protein